MGRMQSAWGVFSVEEKAMAAALAEEDSSVKVWLARTCQVMNEAHCQTPLRPIIRRITVVLQTTRPSIHRAQLGRRAPPIFTSTESFYASAVISASPNLLIFNLDRTLVLSQGQSLITCSTLCPRDLSSVTAGNYWQQLFAWLEQRRRHVRGEFLKSDIRYNLLDSLILLHFSTKHWTVWQRVIHLNW